MMAPADTIRRSCCFTILEWGLIHASICQSIRDLDRVKKYDETAAPMATTLRAIDAELKRQASTPQPLSSIWYPIASAPRDGSAILLALRPEGTFPGDVWPGFWYDGSGNYWKHEGWFAESDRPVLLTAKPTPASDWMPLPAPPRRNTP